MAWRILAARSIGSTCWETLIAISVCGVLAGADGPKAIGVQTRAEWLKK